MNAEIRAMKTAAEVKLTDAFAAAHGRLPGGAAIAEQRVAAFRRFEDQGLPHRRVEEWKYTDLRALMRDAKPLAGPPSAAAIARAKDAGRFPGVDARRLMFVDGAFVPELSDLAALEPGLTIGSFAQALTRGDPLMSRLGHVVPTNDVAVNLNTAFMGDGAVIRVAAGTKIDRPVQLVFAHEAESAAAVFPRSLVIVEDDARLTLIESHDGPAGIDYQVNAVVEIVVGDRARIDRIKIGRDGSQALHLSSLMAELGANAQLFDFAFVSGGAVTRNQLFVKFAGEGSNARINGASLLGARQHVDTTMVVDHAVPGGMSRELFKSVLDDESRAVFQGKIIVRPGAQKTDGKMMSQALLLSDHAEADNKPELEIFADDVVCGHGATAGALDEDLLFYLKARGIPTKEAEALLIQAFVGEAIEAIEHEGVKNALMAETVRWLEART